VRQTLSPLVLHALDPHSFSPGAGQEVDADGEAKPQDAGADEKNRDPDHGLQFIPPPARLTESDLECSRLSTWTLADRALVTRGRAERTSLRFAVLGGRRSDRGAVRAGPSSRSHPYTEVVGRAPFHPFPKELRARVAPRCRQLMASPSGSRQSARERRGGSYLLRQWGRFRPLAETLLDLKAHAGGRGFKSRSRYERAPPVGALSVSAPRLLRHASTPWRGC
jgi:hypothetical protein